MRVSIERFSEKNKPIFCFDNGLINEAKNLSGIIVRENGAEGVVEIVAKDYLDKPVVAIDRLNNRIIVLRRTIVGKDETNCYWADKDHNDAIMGITYKAESGFLIDHPAVGRVVVHE